MKCIYGIIFILIFSLKISFSNDEYGDFFEFTGIVVQATDSITPVSYTRVTSLKSGKSVLADEDGYFYMLLSRQDTIVYQAIGFKKYFLIVNETKDTKEAFNVILMKTDTIALEGVDIIPFYTKDEFRRAMINLDIEQIEVQKPITKDEIQQLVGIKYNAEGLKIRGPISTVSNIFGNKRKQQKKASRQRGGGALPKFKK